MTKLSAWTTPVVLRRMGRRHLGAVRWLRAGYVSAAIVVALVAAALYTLPFSAVGAAAVPIWHVPPGGPVLTHRESLPVFCLSSAGPPIRCGIAEARSGGGVAFQAYDDPQDPNATIPVLTTADMSLLWALADPNARTKIQASAADLARQMALGLHDATEASTWQREYRNRLRTLLERATQQAWQTDDTRRAFRGWLRAGEPVLQDSIANEIGPAIAPYVAEAFWRMVKTTSAQVLSLIVGNPLDLTAMGTSFIAALQDPHVQAAFGRLGPRILELPQTEVLFERFAANVADALQRDADTTALISRAAMDPRLGAELGQVRGNLADFVHELGRVLWGLGDKSTMNSLAGLAVKTVILGQSQSLILLVDPDDAATLVRTIPGRATMLTPEAAPKVTQ